MIVVDHERGAAGKHAEQIPEITPAESHEIGQVFRPQQRQRGRFGVFRQSFAQIIEEGRDVVVAAVELIPQDRDFPRSDVR